MEGVRLCHLLCLSKAMNTKKLSAGLVTAAFLALIAIVVFQQLRITRLQSAIAALREEAGALSSLREENQRLAEQIRTASSKSQNDIGELLRLRAQSTRLRELEQKNTQLLAEQNRLKQTSRPTSQSDIENNPVDGVDATHGPGTQTKIRHTEYWGNALLSYATNHQGQFPTSLADAARFLDNKLSAETQAEVLQTAERFEQVFHGSQADLNSFPIESTLILREKEAWADSKGRWCKTYTFANGFTTMLTYRKKEHFDEFEKIRTPKPKQP
jgi:hypothetical protein